MSFSSITGYFQATSQLSAAFTSRAFLLLNVLPLPLISFSHSQFLCSVHLFSPHCSAAFTRRTDWTLCWCVYARATNRMWWQISYHQVKSRLSLHVVFFILKFIFHWPDTISWQGHLESRPVWNDLKSSPSPKKVRNFNYECVTGTTPQGTPGFECLILIFLHVYLLFLKLWPTSAEWRIFGMKHVTIVSFLSNMKAAEIEDLFGT